MKSPLEVTIVTTTDGVNVGDEYIREGIRVILDSFVENRIQYINRSGDPDPNFCSDRYDFLERKDLAGKLFDADLLIWAGGPVFWRNIRYPKNTESTSANVQWAFLNRAIYERKFRLGKLSLSLGGGSCQPYGDKNGSFFLEEPTCVEEARKIIASNEWVVIRDGVAHNILNTLGLSHALLPCPSILSGKRLSDNVSSFGGVLGVTVMPLCGHFRMEKEVSIDRWTPMVGNFLEEIRNQFKRILFIAYTQEEYLFMSQFVGKERIFFSTNWLDYFMLYPRLSVHFTNRVHGGMCSASFGVPTFVMGNDSRLYVCDQVGFPFRFLLDTSSHEMVDIVMDLYTKRAEWKEKLIAKREEALLAYRDIVGETIGRIPE